MWFWLAGDQKTPRATPGSAGPLELPAQASVYAGYSGSQSCRQCHEEAYEQWSRSHHGLAERQLTPETDRRAFDPARTFQHGSQSTTVVWSNGTGVVTTAGLAGHPESFAVARLIGDDPLRQFLVPFPGGRLQTLEASYDPRSNEWFNVYGEEDRKPGEWGHWTGRGMNWNSMCAACHNTRVRKNYDEKTDTYRTAMTEPTVSCESCHGPLKRHNEWQLAHRKSGGKDPTVRKLSHRQVMDNCAFCHARRTDLTGDFHPGDAFMDHAHLAVVDDTATFYPDGQIRDENYEFSAFSGSKMHQAGVYCLDCHQPHSSKTILPGNFLCLRCHDGSRPDAPAINPVEHSHHRVFGFDAHGALVNPDLTGYDSRRVSESGGECVNCHMPQTVYMQRHWRHDHGFTIPDPLLTRELGIPNACNRCHADKSAEWAAEWTGQWYGSKMERPARERARGIAWAREGDPSARAPLLTLLARENIPYWQASLVRLLGQWPGEPEVAGALLPLIDSSNALVRAEAINSLAPRAQEGGDEPLRQRLRAKLDDEVRAVRVAAARALQDRVDLSSRAGSELLHGLNLNADQPGGQFLKGLLYLARKDRRALEHLRKATEWDPFSPPFHSQYAAALSLFGESAEAAKHLERAAALLPRNADLQYQLALAANEQGDPGRVITHLEQAVLLEPRHQRAWYNLGLARYAQGQPAPALKALTQAETLAPDSPDASYAKATILWKLDRRAEATKAINRVLSLAPNYPGAAELRAQFANPRD